MTKWTWIGIVGTAFAVSCAPPRRDPFAPVAGVEGAGELWGPGCTRAA